MVTKIVEKAKALGATLAGVASFASLQNAPSYQTFGQADWPAEAESVLVLALAHPPGEPELDWWDQEPLGTPGNRRLHRVARGLSRWLEQEYNAAARPLPYQPARGGVFLKDAAALAGIGVIGQNNLLITREHGPHVRLRALFLDAGLEPTGPSEFAPCEDCAMPCRTACPQAAFGAGAYDVARCRLQIRVDEEAMAILASAQSDVRPGKVIKYCRACELACVHSPAVGGTGREAGLSDGEHPTARHSSATRFGNVTQSGK